MNDYSRQANLFKLLNHPARLAILDVLRDDEACVCHLEAKLGLRQAYISQQLAVLRENGLVQDRREGWNVYYQIVNPNVFQVMDAARHLLGILSDSTEAPARSKTCGCPKCAVVYTLV